MYWGIDAFMRLSRSQIRFLPKQLNLFVPSRLILLKQVSVLKLQKSKINFIGKIILFFYRNLFKLQQIKYMCY